MFSTIATHFQLLHKCLLRLWDSNTIIHSTVSDHSLNMHSLEKKNKL